MRISMSLRPPLYAQPKLSSATQKDLVSKTDEEVFRVRVDSDPMWLVHL